jgi:ribosome-associated protein
MTKLKNRINKNGELVLQSDQFRDQPKNTQDCLDRLIELISLAAHKPKKRTPTKPTRGSKERRLTGKKMQADKKKMRKVDYD